MNPLIRLVVFSLALAMNTAALAQASPATCGGMPATIDMSLNGGDGHGTAGDDVIVGTSEGDVIYGYGGEDTICAGDGDDVVYAGQESDVIFGGAGDDTLYGHAGADTVHGDSGNDTILGGIGDDELWGDDGDDDLRGQGGSDTLYGGVGIDQLLGGAGHDWLETGPGGNRQTDAVVSGQGGNDRLIGGPDDDDLAGGPGLDTILGGDGHDRLAGGNGADRIEGGDGDDLLLGEGAADMLLGGNGEDHLMGGPGDDDLVGGDGDDALYGEGGIDTCDGSGTLPVFIEDVATPTCEFTTGVATGAAWDRFQRPDGLVATGDYAPSGHRYRITGTGSHLVSAQRHTFQQASKKVMIAYLELAESPGLIAAEFRFRNVAAEWAPSGGGPFPGENAVIGTAQYGFGAGSVQLAIWRTGWQLFVVQSPIIDPYPVLASARFDEPLQENTRYTFAMDWDASSSSVTVYPPVGPSEQVIDPWINQYWGRFFGFQMRRPFDDHGMVDFSKVAAW